jgi:heavy metal sensor kinase
MRASLYAVIDKGLRDRAQSLTVFLEEISALPGAGMEEELQEHALPGQGGNLFQVREQGGRWLFRSRMLEAGQIQIPPPSGLAEAGFYDAMVEGHQVRLFAQRTMVGAAPYAIEVGAITDEAASALAGFGLLLWIAAPIFVVAASGGAYWISRRALAPVDQITNAAQRISIESLQDRLPVPQTRDELQRLSETLNQMFARLESSVRRLAQFTADASHELRTPVSVIRTTAEIAVRRQRSAEDYRQALQEILEEAEQTSFVVDSLMLLARADSGTPGASREPGDLSVIVRGAADAGEKLARGRGVEFSVKLNGDPLPVNADSQALRRVLLILMDNAVKYTAPGGWVKVEAMRQNGHGVVTVSDNGIGISSAELPHIFDRFWRADPARSRDSGGAGLGLSIAHSIASTHGGTIDVESDPGKGSVFRLTVPLESQGQ